ncbi:MAG TPA: DnaB-like helicase C-terminal domain-containing protein [Gemmatimonadaceae bacterium]|nr:DnaB-like helicase C-terminal domain-containing protein [Gemmatimonadaceae bacterium]
MSPASRGRQDPLADLLARVDRVSDGERPPDTVPTGFPSIDRTLGGGLRRGELVVIGGDVGSGKSALVQAIALRTATAGYRTAYVTSELSPERVHERLLAIEGRARVDDLRTGALSEVARAELGAVALRLRDTMPEVRRLPGGGVGALADLLGGHGGASWPALIVVDPLQGLADDARVLDESLAAAMRDLKTLALDLDVAVLLTAHLPRLEPRADMRPVLDDFGALGAVKQHADCVLALFREGMYDTARALEGATELIVRKRRTGGTGYVDLYFYAQWLRFEDVLD